MTRAAVVGAGTMGNGIAHVFAQHEWDVTLIDTSAAALERATATIRGNAERQVKKGTLAPEAVALLLGRITPATALDAAAGASIVIEAQVTDHASSRQRNAAYRATSGGSMSRFCAFCVSRMRLTPARVRPAAAATSVSVCSGRSALNARITARPRANDCTYESPGLSGASGVCATLADSDGDAGRALLMCLREKAMAGEVASKAETIAYDPRFANLDDTSAPPGPRLFV